MTPRGTFVPIVPLDMHKVPMPLALVCMVTPIDISSHNGQPVQCLNKIISNNIFQMNIYICLKYELYMNLKMSALNFVVLMPIFPYDSHGTLYHG